MNSFIDDTGVVIIQTREQYIDEKFLFDILHKEVWRWNLRLTFTCFDWMPWRIRCNASIRSWLCGWFKQIANEARSDNGWAIEQSFNLCYETLLVDYLMFKSNSCLWCEFSNTFSFVIVRRIFRLSTNVFIKINRISKREIFFRTVRH